MERMAAIEKLIDLMIEAFEYVKPWVVVLAYQTGGMLRFGRFRKELKPGYYFKWPFFEYGEVHDTAITTFRLPPQTLGKRTVRGTLKYRIDDIKPFIVDIFSEENLLRDATMAHINLGLREGREDLILERLRREVTQYGFKIYKLTLVEDTEAPTFRIILDQQEVVD
jgi:hypothetical protein